MSEERYMIHLLVSREDGTQLVAIPMDDDSFDMTTMLMSHAKNYEKAKEALDAALRSTLDGE